MALKLAGKNPAKFEFDDGVSQTVVTIQPDDEPDVVRTKLQRVLELEGGAPAAYPAADGDVLVLGPQTFVSDDAKVINYRGENYYRSSAPQPPVFTPADRAATDARLQAVQTSGWNEDADMDNLPEYG